MLDIRKNLSPKRRSGRKSFRDQSPFKKLSVSTSSSPTSRMSPRTRQRIDSNASLDEPVSPGTPYSTDKYTHTTYTTYATDSNGIQTKYTRYDIRRSVAKFELDQRTNIYQTTFKTMHSNQHKGVPPSWYTTVQLWTLEQKHGETPSTPRMRAIGDLARGQLSPRRFSLDGLSSPI